MQPEVVSSSISWPFANRRTAGVALAEPLADLAGRDDLLVLALPRGGVPVAYEVARRLDAPLDVLIVRKLGVPGHEEYAMGALASGGVMVLDRGLVRRLRLPQSAIDAVLARERTELARRECAFRGDRPPVHVDGKTVILVDDGLATGSTMRAAVEALRAAGPRAIVVAVPVASPDTCRQLAPLAERMLCLVKPDPFGAVGLWYRDFGDTPDDEVRDLLARRALDRPMTS